MDIIANSAGTAETFATFGAAEGAVGFTKFGQAVEVVGQSARVQLSALPAQ